MKIRGRLAAVAAAGAYVALTLAHVQPAWAVHVTCGQTITANTTLDSDVGPCPGDGIIIGADNITLDLGTHRVVGNADHGASGEFAGIRLPARTGVTVRNGTVTGFEAGVLTRGGGGNTATRLVLRDNIGPLRHDADLGDGLLIDGSNNNIVSENVIDHNGFFDGVGVIGDSSGNQIRRNSISNNNLVGTLGPSVGGGTGTPDSGVFLEGVSHHNTVAENSIVGNGYDGIFVGGYFGPGFQTHASFHTITRNSIVGNGFVSFQVGPEDVRPGMGIEIGQNNRTNVVEGNNVRNNAGSGIYVGPSAPPFGLGGGGNRFTGNVALGNGVAAQIGQPTFLLFDLQDGQPACRGNIWQGNTYGTRNQPCIN